MDLTPALDAGPALAVIADVPLTADTFPLLPDYATPALMDSFVLQGWDTLIGTLAFLIGIFHQGELSKAPGYDIAAFLIAAIALLLTHVMEFLRALAARPTRLKIHLLQVLQKITYIALAYAMGLLIRILADPITNGPQKGFFGVGTIFLIIVLLVALVVFLFERQMLHSTRRDLLALINAPLIAAK